MLVKSGSFKNISQWLKSRKPALRLTKLVFQQSACRLLNTTDFILLGRLNSPVLERLNSNLYLQLRLESPSV